MMVAHLLNVQYSNGPISAEILGCWTREGYKLVVSLPARCIDETAPDGVMANIMHRPVTAETVGNVYKLPPIPNE